MMKRISIPIHSEQEANKSQGDSLKNIPIKVNNYRPYKAFDSQFGNNCAPSPISYNSLRSPIKNPWMLSKFRDDLSINNNDRWHVDMERRFDDERAEWDSYVRKKRNDFFTQSNDLFPQPRISESSNSPVSTHYDEGKDGRIHFIARFDMNGFDENDFKLDVVGQQLTVSGIREERIGSNRLSKECTRSVDLPRNANIEQISASYTRDNILLVDCPIQPLVNPISTQTKFNTNSLSDYNDYSDALHRSNIRSYSTKTPYSISSEVFFPSKEPSNPESSNYDVEIPIGNDYLPNEILVRTLNGRVLVNARHEEKIDNRNSYREFSKEYNIPGNIDPNSIVARLNRGVLHLQGVPLR